MHIEMQLSHFYKYKFGNLKDGNRKKKLMEGFPPSDHSTIIILLVLCWVSELIS